MEVYTNYTNFEQTGLMECNQEKKSVTFFFPTVHSDILYSLFHPPPWMLFLNHKVVIT